MLRGKAKTSSLARGFAGNNIMARWVLAVFCAAVICASMTPAQTAPQTKPRNLEGGREINQSGYTLKPTGLGVEGWPAVRSDFSIKRNDNKPFTQLITSDITAKLDGKPVAIKEGDLKITSGEPARVLLMIDGSGSMVSSSFAGDKLTAAKLAIHAFIDGLKSDDLVSIYGFDERPYLVTRLTSDKATLNRAVDNFRIRPTSSSYTALYDAADYSLEEAIKNNIRFVILLSDGMEDSPAYNALSPKARPQHKQDREQRIAGISRGKDIRIHTIAIGDKNGSGMNHVDALALSNISKGANGGSAPYIDLPRLKRDAEGSEDMYQFLLRRELKQTYDTIRESVHSDYSLTLRLGPNLKQDNDTHKLLIDCAVGNDDPRVHLIMDYTYTWLPGEQFPIFRDPNLRANLIPKALITVPWQWLLTVYLSILVILASLAAIPIIGRRITMSNETRRVGKAIDTVRRNSPLIGSQCGNEGANAGRRYLIKEGDIVIVCTKCGTVHHLSCWQLSKGQCYNRTCQHQIDVPPDLLARHGIREERKMKYA